MTMSYFRSALIRIAIVLAATVVCLAPSDPTQAKLLAGPHTPSMGSAERRAITDALRGDQKVVFKIHYLKVHGDWAWIDVTPLDEQGKAVAEGGRSLMHQESGHWKLMDLSVLPEDPEN